MGIDENNNMQVKEINKVKNYKLLHVLEFNSTRKRMSTIIEENGRYYIYCKGADSIILSRLDNNKS